MALVEWDRDVADRRERDLEHRDGGHRGQRKDHGSARLRVRAVELVEANRFVAQHHRHHKPVQGHRFSLGAFEGDQLVGVAVVGRPVARNGGSPSTTLEVTRLATDGTRNACSLLYGAAARAGKALGYERIQTYILSTEPGTSLRASGWICEGEAGGGQWEHSGEIQLRLDGHTRATDQPTGKKQRWARAL